MKTINYIQKLDAQATLKELILNDYYSYHINCNEPCDLNSIAIILLKEQRLKSNFLIRRKFKEIVERIDLSGHNNPISIGVFENLEFANLSTISSMFQCYLNIVSSINTPYFISMCEYIGRFPNSDLNVLIQIIDCEFFSHHVLQCNIDDQLIFKNWNK